MVEFVLQLRERASKSPKRIVYPEATDPRVLRAAARIVELRMAKPILVGSPEAVESKARELGINISHIEIVDPKTLNLADRYVGLLLPDWKSRGIIEVEALKRFEKRLYFAAAMDRAGDAAGFVGGGATTTADTGREAISCLGLIAASEMVA